MKGFYLAAVILLLLGCDRSSQSRVSASESMRARQRGVIELKRPSGLPAFCLRIPANMRRMLLGDKTEVLLRYDEILMQLGRVPTDEAKDTNVGVSFYETEALRDEAITRLRSEPYRKYNDVEDREDYIYFISKDSVGVFLISRSSTITIDFRTPWATALSAAGRVREATHAADFVERALIHCDEGEKE